MLWEPTLCCCFKIKTGSLILGFFLLIGSLFYIGLDATVLADGSIFQFVRDKCAGRVDYKECEAFFIKFAHGTVISGLVIGVAEVLVSSLLIYGIFKEKTRLFIPFMMMLLIQVVVHIIFASGLLIMAGTMKYWTEMIIFVVVFTLYIFFETFLLLVVRSHYLQIKRSKMVEYLVMQKYARDSAATEEIRSQF